MKANSVLGFFKKSTARGPAGRGKFSLSALPYWGQFWAPLFKRDRELLESEAESSKDDYGTGRPLLWEKADRPGPIKPGEDIEGILSMLINT